MKMHMVIGMMLILLSVIMMMITIFGCGGTDRLGTAITGKPSEVCVSGVAYLQFTSGATVKYTPEGKIARCQD